MRRVLALVLVLVACTPARRDDEDDGTSTPDAGAAACTQDSDCGAHGSCDTGSGTCGCGPGFHACGAQCLSNDAVGSCGQRCSPCPLPADGKGTASCENQLCAVTCGEGELFCGGACIACPGTCVDGACRTDCASGTHRCGTRCVGDHEPSACGAACVECVPPAGSGLVASCVDGGCRFACGTSGGTCRGVCGSGPCAWTKAVESMVGGNVALAADASGNLFAAWSTDDGWGYEHPVGSSDQPQNAGLCAPGGKIGLGIGPRGPAVLCPTGNFQAPMQLHEFTPGRRIDTEVDHAVTSANSLVVGGDVFAWVSDAHLYIGRYENGAWGHGVDSRVVSQDSIRGLSLLSDPAGRPVLAFSEMDWQAMRFHTVALTRTASGWEEQVVGEGLPFGVKYVMLPDGSLGAAWVQWSQADNATLLYWAEQKHGFLAEIVARDVTGSSQEDLFDVAVDRTGAPRVAYASTPGISFALKAGSSWLSETVATGSYREVRLVLTPGGAPVIAARPWTQTKLEIWR